MCPKCNGPTIKRPLFTSLYDHCERCETPARQAPAIAPRVSMNSCAEIDMSQAPFVVGDTVYRTDGSYMTQPRIVERVEKKTIRKMRDGTLIQEWYVRLKGSVAYRNCSFFTKDAPKQAAKAA